jgi:hypothetical protein
MVWNTLGWYVLHRQDKKLRLRIQILVGVDDPRSQSPTWHQIFHYTMGQHWNKIDLMFSYPRPQAYLFEYRIIRNDRVSIACLKIWHGLPIEKLRRSKTERISWWPIRHQYAPAIWGEWSCVSASPEGDYGSHKSRQWLAPIGCKFNASHHQNNLPQGCPAVRCYPTLKALVNSHSKMFLWARLQIGGVTRRSKVAVHRRLLMVRLFMGWYLLVGIRLYTLAQTKS